MITVKQLYRKVFGSDTMPFSINEDNYIVLVNQLQKETQEMLAENLKCYMDDTQYSEITLESLQNEHEVTREFVSLREKAYEQYANIDINFVLLFDGQSESLKENVQTILAGLKNAACLKERTGVAIAVLVPADREMGVKCIMPLKDVDFPQRSILYLVAQEEYRKDKTMDVICGLMLLYGKKHLCEQNKRNIDQAMQRIYVSLDNIGETGKQMITSSKDIIWAGLYAKFENEKMSFLRQYISGLLRNVSSFDSIDIRTLCENYYSCKFNITNTEEMAKRLNKAIQYIPKHVNMTAVQDEALENYFSQAYSYDGKEIVELTMQLNLSKWAKTSGYAVAEAADYVIQKAADYHSDDIFRDIIKAIQDYISLLKDTVENQKVALKKFLQIDDNLQNGIHEYINRYLRYYRYIREIEFWGDVKDYINTNADRYAEITTKAQVAVKDLQIAQNGLIVHGYGSGDVYPHYPAQQVLNIEQNSDLCNEIAKKYQQMSEVQTIYNREEELPTFASVVPKYASVIWDCRYDSNVCGTYCLKIEQRIGRYFVFDIEFAS